MVLTSMIMYIARIFFLLIATELINLLQYPKKRYKKDPRNIEDVYDGIIYQSMIKDQPTGGEIVSLQVNTDGVQIFKSSKASSPV